MQSLKIHFTADRIQLWISVLLRGILLIAAGVSLWDGLWTAAFASIATFGATFLPAIFARNYRVILPTEFELIAVLFLFATIFLGEVGGFYTRFWWWDIALHAGAGLVFGFIGFLILYALHTHGKLDARPGLIAFFAFTFSLAIGAAWEIFEFCMDTFFGFNMQKSGLIDTMGDLIIDAAAAFVVACAGYVYLRYRIRGSGIFHYLLNRFLLANPEFFKR